MNGRSLNKEKDELDDGVAPQRLEKVRRSGLVFIGTVVAGIGLVCCVFSLSMIGFTLWTVPVDWEEIFGFVILLSVGGYLSWSGLRNFELGLKRSKDNDAASPLPSSPKSLSGFQAKPSSVGIWRAVCFIFGIVVLCFGLFGAYMSVVGLWSERLQGGNVNYVDQGESYINLLLAILFIAIGALVIRKYLRK